MTVVESERVCADTGLALRPCTGQAVWRIQKSSYGPLNPLVPDDRGEVSKWGRWDVFSHRTIYASSTALGAYLETLQCFRLEPEASPPLSDLFDDEPDDGTTLLDAVRVEWDVAFHFPPGLIPRGWRSGRSLYELRLPESGWLVDISHSASVSALGRELHHVLPLHGLSELTVSELHGSNRTLTTVIAESLHRLVLDDGSLPRGILYQSKWGAEQSCFAMWLRALDDGKELSSEPTKLLLAHDIEWNDTNLETAMRRHNLTRTF